MKEKTDIELLLETMNAKLAKINTELGVNANVPVTTSPLPDTYYTVAQHQAALKLEWSKMGTLLTTLKEDIDDAISTIMRTYRL